MSKHSRRERDQRQRETERVREIEGAWMGSLTPAVKEAHIRGVEAARARGPLQPPPDMAPGTRPNPPRVEPRPPKNVERPKRRF